MQDIYQQRSNWKFILAVIGAIILITTILYSNYLAKNLEENELKNAKVYEDAIEFLKDNNTDLNADVRVHEYIINNFSLPVIMKDDKGELSAFNFPEHKTNDKVYLQEEINKYIASGKKPMKGTGYSTEIYTFNSELLSYIRYFPLVQFFLVGSFIAFGYFLFNSSKRAEQNRVWAGMAKETAHQLGTPISAIMGWVTLLKENKKNDSEIIEVAAELEKDVERLNLVADRFSKIGSAPELQAKDLAMEVESVVTYMEKRASKNVQFEITKNEGQIFISNINSHLFEWVIENLLRNSLDAMDGKGKISLHFYIEEKYNCVDITDTGKGIPISKFDTIFNPGYSTKLRGWGLGLSLAKRIIEEYHSGKIFVKASKQDEFTTFCVKLKMV